VADWHTGYYYTAKTLRRRAREEAKRGSKKDRAAATAAGDYRGKA